MVAITGIILVGFVFFHLIGNLYFFFGPEAINEYGGHLRQLPYGLLWVLRIGLFIAAVLHIVTTILLVKENRAAKGGGYAYKATVQVRWVTRLMAVSGLLLLAYIVFHILHFTTHNVSPQFAGWKDGPNHDVYRMMVYGFSNVAISVSYIIAMVLLAMHLSHGVASLFQTLGLRTKKLAVAIRRGAQVFAWVICLGFASIPAAVLAGCYDHDYIQKVEAAAGKEAK